MPVNSNNPHDQPRDQPRDQRQGQPNNLPRRVSDPQRLAELRTPQDLPQELERVADRFEALVKDDLYRSAQTLMEPWADRLLSPELFGHRRVKQLALSYAEALLGCGFSMECELFALSLAGKLKVAEEPVLCQVALVLAAEACSRQLDPGSAKGLLEQGLTLTSMLPEGPQRAGIAAVFNCRLGMVCEEEGDYQAAARHYELARCQAILGHRAELAAVAQVAHAVVLCHIDANPEKLIPALQAAVCAAERHGIAEQPRGLTARAELALLLLQQGDTHGALQHLEFLDAQPKCPLDKLLVAAKAVAFELSDPLAEGPSAEAVGLLKRALRIEALEDVHDREPTVENLLAGLLVDWGDRGLIDHQRRLVDFLDSQDI